MSIITHMGKLIILLALLSFNVSSASNDKIKHFAASAVIGAGAQYYFNNWRYSSVTCLSVGIVKELTDSTIDHKDLLYDAVGCATGILAYTTTNYILSVKPIDHGAQINLSFKF